MSMIIDGTNGLTFNNATTQNSGGKVLQVVQGSTTTTVSLSTNTFTDTTLSATITPLFSTSKILVMFSQAGCRKATNNTAIYLTLLRGSTTIFTLMDIGLYNETTTLVRGMVLGSNYLDSPATTSATTYKTQLSSLNNNAVVSVQDFGNVVTTSTITLMEIAA
jgi:hypothetical protein